MTSHLDSAIDNLHVQLRTGHESDADDDRDFDSWVGDQAHDATSPYQADAAEFLRLSGIEELALAAQPFADLLEYPGNLVADAPIKLEVYPEDVIRLQKALAVMKAGAQQNAAPVAKADKHGDVKKHNYVIADDSTQQVVSSHQWFGECSKALHLSQAGGKTSLAWYNVSHPACPQWVKDAAAVFAQPRAL